MPFVQNFIIKKVTNNLSQKLHTKVSIQHVDFTLFNRMELEGLLIEDHHQDTLLYAGTALVKITDWFFWRDKPTLKYIGLQNTFVNLNRTDSVWNYQFLIDYFSSPKKNTSSKSNFNFDFKIIELKNFQLKETDKWVGEDTKIAAGNFYLKANTFDLDKKIISISTINLDEPEFAQSTYHGNHPPHVKSINSVSTSLSTKKLKWNEEGWKISINEIDLKNGRLNIDAETPNRAAFTDLFDGLHIKFYGITGSLKNIKLLDDTLHTDLTLKVKEQCGFEVKKFQSKIKFTPDIMEFNNLLIQTNKSRIENYFAMHYADFNNDMNNFIHNVTMQADFKNSDVSTDDIAFFAPELKSWNRMINVTGVAKGTVDNLSAKKIIVKSGNSSIDGDIALRGLPDIDNTFIDLNSNELRTNYTDLITLVPSLKNITKPRLNALSNIRFNGNFTGFIYDFVAFGNISTNLGNIYADLNMKLPKNKPAAYSGKISSQGFQLGQFVNSSLLGNIALDGKINGKGFKLNNFNANFDGEIHQLEFSGYNYSNITINGNFEKKLFRGHVDIDDPNLKLENLDGTINLEGESTQFNFDAYLKYANLKQLQLTDKDFAFSGHFNFDFTGNNIDNFLGTAKVFNASLFHDSTQLSFDSLTLISKIENGNKILSAQSNEIEGTLTGNFKIQELPDAFKVFLNRYFPSYIKKPDYVVSNQDFSFLIKTREVDDYVQLFNDKFNGFNYSSISGNIKLDKNELNVNASIPEFEYDKKIFNDVVLQSKGNLDSLSATLTSGDIILTDSLHLPATNIKLTSHNDISAIQIKTSAGKTLNDAELNATVQTLTDGVNIHFAPSSFILNDKKWQLEKDGTLTLRQSVVEANDIKFTQENQLISIHSENDANNITNVIAKLSKVNINDFSSIVLPKSRLEGILTGTLTLKDPLGKQLINFESEAKDFHSENKMVGDVKLKANFNPISGMLQFDAQADGKENLFSLSGHYNYKDSTENQLDADFMSDHFNLNILEPYLNSIFSDFKGDAMSTLKIKGGGHKYVLGSVTVTGGSFKVNYTQCTYKFTNKTILFNPDEIDLGNIQLKDTLNNIGEASGKIYHNFFDDFSFDQVRIETKKMLVLNTTKKDNSDFYGKVIGSALMTLNGPISNLIMNIDGKPSPLESDSSHIYIASGSSREAGLIDYIEFVQFGNKMKEGILSREGTNITVNMNLTATPSCKIDVILDEELGDVLKGRGNGLLNIHVGSNEPLTIRGRYDITDGEYTFNFQTVMKKYFSIKRGSLVWNGDPYQAQINIDAEYLARNVDVSSLASSKGFQQKVDITIVSHLTGNLQKPDISFDFELPINNEIRDDYIAVKKLEDFKNDPNEMNKQVASLLLFNAFLNNNQNVLTGGTPFSLAANTIGGIVSNLLTHMFNKQLEKATSGILSTYFDINSSLDLQSKAAVLQASFKAGLKILLSNRLVALIGGNFDYNNPYAQLAGKGLLTPDINIEWMLNKDGSIRVVAFNRTSIDLTLGQRNRTGISLAYRKDFDHLSEIFKKKIPKQKEPVKVKLIPSNN